MTETVYLVKYKGRLPRVNEWHGAHTIAGKARIFESTPYKRAKRDMVPALAAAKAGPTIDYPVDMIVVVALWKMLDTDAIAKGTMDALELAGVVKDDRLIRDVLIRRRYHKRDEADQISIRLYVTGEERIGEDFLSRIRLQPE